LENVEPVVEIVTPPVVELIEETVISEPVAVSDEILPPPTDILAENISEEISETPEIVEESGTTQEKVPDELPSEEVIQSEPVEEAVQEPMAEELTEEKIEVVARVENYLPSAAVGKYDFLIFVWSLF